METCWTAGAGSIGFRTPMPFGDPDELRRCKLFGAEPAPRPFREPVRADALDRAFFQRMHRATLNEYGNRTHAPSGRHRSHGRGCSHGSKRGQQQPTNAFLASPTSLPNKQNNICMIDGSIEFEF